ncbi:C-type lectin domain family 17, member A-like [Mya arenaria]|uniref:C-type lectin domain family 17, member A-like n=1 Tax=Mya arenaria TaxID=6604 RepID=UPI0022DF5CF0|nr:C-type lectin domain family 17, member A-like [Mya arenaria]
MMNILLLVFLFYHACNGQCPDGWLRHVDSCYHFSHDQESYTGAQAICHEMAEGSTLVEIETLAENSYLAHAADMRKLQYRIGLTDLAEEGIWLWSGSKEHATYFSWGPGEPNGRNSAGDEENCVVIETAGTWHDVICHDFRHYICELRLENAVVVG